jgi:hypothetical protein
MLATKTFSFFLNEILSQSKRESFCFRNQKVISADYPTLSLLWCYKKLHSFIQKKRKEVGVLLFFHIEKLK